MRHATTILATAAVLGLATPALAAAPPPKGQAARKQRSRAASAPAPAPAPAATPAPAKQAAPKPAAEKAAPKAQAVPAAAVAAPAAASTDRRLPGNGTADTVLPERELNGHYFLAIPRLASPFITSHVGSFTTAGTADFDDVVMPEELGGGTLDLPFLALAQSFELQIGILDRVAVRVGADGTAALPRDEESAILIAAIGGFSTTAGATVKAIETQYFQVAGSFDYTYGYNLTAFPLGLLAGLPEIDPANMFEDVTSDTYSFGVQGAFAPHELIGLVLDLQWDAENDSEGTNDAFFRFGGGISLNFESVGVPIGLVGSYVERIAVDDENDTETDRVLGGGFYYTGRRYLDVGLVIQHEILEGETADLYTLAGTTVLRAYF
ncbi:hypothetical protein [Vulgatibacter sp.]|uniref:hypothetical protein n=1 Tax=Vulgatibacter sp. TaxID=1971226 RepID=UPI003563144A